MANIGEQRAGGQGGIRTLERLLTVTHFPGVRLKPLGHLSGIPPGPSVRQARRARYPASAPNANPAPGRDFPGPMNSGEALSGTNPRDIICIRIIFHPDVYTNVVVSRRGDNFVVTAA